MHWFSRHATGRPKHPDVLTPAEWRVLEHLREGRSNPEIAEALGVSVNTVRTHVSSMLAKLDLSDRQALAAWDGEPAEASRAALGRFHLGAPLAWLVERGWLGRVALAGVAVAVAAVFLVAFEATTNPGGSTPGSAETPAATETPTPTPTVEEPSEPTTSPTPAGTERPLLMPFAGVSVQLGEVLPVDDPLPIAEVLSPFEPIEWSDPDLHLYDVIDMREWNFGESYPVGLNPNQRHFAWVRGERGSGEPGLLQVIDLQTGEQREIGTVRPTTNPPFWFGEEYLVYDDLGSDARVVVNVVTPGASAPSADEVSPPSRPLPGNHGMTGDLLLMEVEVSAANLWRRRWRLDYLDGSRPPVLFDAHYARLGPDNSLVFAVTSMPEPSRTPGVPRRPEDLVTPGNVYVADPFTMEAEYVATVRMDYWNWPLDVSRERIAWTQDYCSAEPRTQIVDRQTGEVTTLATGDWLKFTPDGDIAFGAFGAKRILDVETLQYRAVLPEGVGDVGWSPDYRYATRERQGGHGGLCP